MARQELNEVGIDNVSIHDLPRILSEAEVNVEEDVAYFYRLAALKCLEEGGSAASRAQVYATLSVSAAVDEQPARLADKFVAR